VPDVTNLCMLIVAQQLNPLDRLATPHGDKCLAGLAGVRAAAVGNVRQGGMCGTGAKRPHLCCAPSKCACRFSGLVVVMPQVRHTYTSPAPTAAAAASAAHAPPALSASLSVSMPACTQQCTQHVLCTKMTPPAVLMNRSDWPTLCWFSGSC
jgi:hypothetical protein